MFQGLAGVCPQKPGYRQSPSSPPSVTALATGRLCFGTTQSELLTPERLGLTLGQLDGEGGCCGADPLGIWQPHGLEPRPSQAADWPPASIGDLVIPWEGLSSAPACVGPGCQSTWPPCWQFKMLPDSLRARVPVYLRRDLWEAVGPARIC